jgi:hypothetical protein
MAETRTAEGLIDELAEEFARRCRAGERPSVEEYAQRYPAWADDIRAVLPAVVLMEQLKPHRPDTVPSSSAAPAEMPGRISDYRIVREIGRGGMGVVYEAEQEALGRRVAIKVLPAHLLTNEQMRERFRREAQAAARLHHTNIVPVFGVGECDGQCFYVMQLINGRGLDQLLRDQIALPASTAAPSPASAPRWPPPWRRPTRRGCCTATSSLPTCCWATGGRCGSRTSGLPSWSRRPT